ncbi:MAG: GTPase, partial [Brevundimonas sp.]|nr:GTPase [Brevundimonas sp.]
LVGYTNAGKSTLFNHLTGAEVVAKDLLFATLDPTQRMIRLPQGRSALIADTVGFISDLPHELVESFRATLEEVAEADLILHVRDISSPETDAEAKDVEEVLARITPTEGEEEGTLQVRTLEVWNKIDRLDPETHAAMVTRAGTEGAVAVSALTGEGLEVLRQAIAARIDTDPEIHLTLEPQDGEALAWLYEHGRITARTEDADGRLQISVRLSEPALGRYGRMFGTG